MLCCKRRGQSRHEIVQGIRSVSEYMGEVRENNGSLATWDGWIRVPLWTEVQLRANFILQQPNQWKSPESYQIEVQGAGEELQLSHCHASRAGRRAREVSKKKYTERDFKKLLNTCSDLHVTNKQVAASQSPNETMAGNENNGVRWSPPQLKTNTDDNRAGKVACNGLDKLAQLADLSPSKW